MEESGFTAMVGAGMGVFIAAVTNVGILDFPTRESPAEVAASITSFYGA